MDGEIPVSDKPIRLAEGEAGVAAALIKGLAKNKLPIVYVSCGFDGMLLVDPSELARYVSGMAHVIVEPSREFSYQVKNLTTSKNAFGGTVGVYWPESDAKKSYFVDDGKVDKRTMQLEIAKDIRLALANRRLRSTCTWGHLQETISRNRYELLKSQGSTELQEYVDVFEAEQAAKDEKLIEAEQEISRLHSEIRRLSASVDSCSAGFISAGEEQDLYTNEIREIVIAALREAYRLSREGSRRQHVLADLLAKNKTLNGSEKNQEEIKNLFRAYRDMDSSTRTALNRLGFSLSEEGKHYKLVFQGDGRYTVTLPKTSSDHRAGKNIASDINNLIF